VVTGLEKLPKALYEEGGGWNLETKWQRKLDRKVLEGKGLPLEESAEKKRGSWVPAHPTTRSRVQEFLLKS